MNQQIRLRPMDRTLLHEYYKGFVMDADLFMDMSRFRAYTYAPERVDAYFDKLRSQKDRVDFLILLDEKPIGEIALKHIDETARRCELSIHLQNDSVKNKGYGTQAERLILNYAFQTLGMETVIADSVLKNMRSQHTLEKVGFQETGRDETFVYYKISKSDVRSEISIKKADKNDLKKIYDMQLTAFRPLLDKYKDYETSPAAETFERTLQRFRFDNVSYHLITLGTAVIGAVRVRWNDDIYVLSQIIILPEYQGLGYAQEAIRQVEAAYPNASRWRLDTIEQEAKLCHLYEKMGYHKTGHSEHIKDGMDIIFYEKVMDV